MKFEFKTLQELAHYAIDDLKNGVGLDTYGCDLHNELFNTDYYIIGYYAAEQWIIANTGVFNGIAIVKEYEIDNFGSVSTDFSNSERVANMLAYIGSQEVLQASATIKEYWDDCLTQDNINDIISELETAFNLN